MTDILFEKGIREHKDSKKAIYLLEDAEMFSQLGYKVLLSQKATNLLNAAKIKHNGQTELIYLTGDYQTYSNILPQLPREGVFMVCAKIIEAILHVKNQGFLIPENLDISLDRIYFDPNTLEAYLVYLPLSAGDDGNEGRFEMGVRHLLLRLIKQSNAIVSERERMVSETLASTSLTLEEIDKMLNETGYSGIKGSADGKNPAKAKHLNLISMNPNLQMHYQMQKGEIHIGRKKDNDMILDFTNSISRLHCTIYQEGDFCFVKDENSSFGTGLNGKKLIPGKGVRLNEDDVLMLPGIKFKVKFM